MKYTCQLKTQKLIIVRPNSSISWSKLITWFGRKKGAKSIVPERNSPAFLETALHSRAWLIRDDTGRQKRKFVLKSATPVAPLVAHNWEKLIGRRRLVVFLNIQQFENEKSKKGAHAFVCEARCFESTTRRGVYGSNRGSQLPSYL